MKKIYILNKKNYEYEIRIQSKVIFHSLLFSCVNSSKNNNKCCNQPNKLVGVWQLETNHLGMIVQC